MAKKEYMLGGKSLEELSRLSVNEFAAVVPARARRSLKRGLTESQKALIAKLKKSNDGKTHARDMIILPAMVGKRIHIHNGKEFIPVLIEPDMLGHALGEFALTRRGVKHSSPGIGATKSSSSLSVK